MFLGKIDLTIISHNIFYSSFSIWISLKYMFTTKIEETSSNMPQTTPKTKNYHEFDCFVQRTFHENIFSFISRKRMISPAQRQPQYQVEFPEINCFRWETQQNHNFLNKQLAVPFITKRSHKKLIRKIWNRSRK